MSKLLYKCRVMSSLFEPLVSSKLKGVLWSLKMEELYQFLQPFDPEAGDLGYLWL